MRAVQNVRRAFTLIELLVVIAIIAILIALLVPAVQKVREAASRTQCLNNIKQLSLACTSYHDVKKSLPPACLMRAGISRTAGSANFGPNWMVLILPYIEQGGLYDQVSVSVGNYMATGDNTWRNIRSTRRPIWECPADIGHNIPWNGDVNGPANIGGGWARGNYGCNAGGIHQPTPPTGVDGTAWLSTEGGKSPTYGSFASFGEPVPDGTAGGGVMCINWGARLGNVNLQDGTSNTMMLGELRVGAFLGAMDSRGTWALGMPGGSVICGGWSWDSKRPNDTNLNADDCETCQQTDNGSGADANGMGSWPGCPFQQATARSRHLNGVAIAFCDGSVRFITSNLNQTVWWAIACRDDGQQFTMPK